MCTSWTTRSSPIDDPTGRSLYDADRDIVLGHEFVGEVIGHGPGCTDQFAVGSRVTAMPVRLVDGGAGGVRIIGQHPEAQGSFAELLVVSEVAAKPVSGDVSSDAVALTDAFAVGEFYVRSAQIQPGEIAIVIGAGAIGLSAVAALASSRRRPDYRGGLSNPSAASWPAIASARMSWSIPPRSRRSTRSGRYAPNADCPARLSFSSASAPPGLIQNIVESAEMATRIYCAGGWYTGDTLDITTATRQGVTIQFGGGPHPQDWYGTLDAIASGRLDPLPSVGKIITLDEVPDALDLARKSDGPPRIMVHPNGDVA